MVLEQQDEKKINRYFKKNPEMIKKIQEESLSIAIKSGATVFIVGFLLMLIFPVLGFVIIISSVFYGQSIYKTQLEIKIGQVVKRYVL